MMGPEPNVWTPSNTQDALPSLNFSDSESFDKLYKVFSNSQDAKNAKQNNDDSSDVGDSVLLVIAISQKHTKALKHIQLLIVKKWQLAHSTTGTLLTRNQMLIHNIMYPLLVFGY